MSPPSVLLNYFKSTLHQCRQTVIHCKASPVGQNLKKKENSNWIFSFLATGSLIDLNSYVIIYVQQQNE